MAQDAGKKRTSEANMGLTINYTLLLGRRLPGAVIRELVECAALYARKIGCAEVGAVLPVAADTPGTFWHVQYERQGERYVCSIPAKRGWVVEVWPGEGCESALFGLCQYPCTIPLPYPVPTGAGSGWVLNNYCTTQYASEHGWEHFLRCHKMILSILKFWRQMGVTVEVNDEGGYWETGSEKKLRATLQGYNGLIAAMAGAFKDASDASGKGYSVESPIFAQGDFEQFEAQGWQEFGKQLSQLPSSPERQSPITKRQTL
jgi:hypothetical protein